MVSGARGEVGEAEIVGSELLKFVWERGRVWARQSGIGQQLPGTVPTWKGVAREVLVRHALRLVADRGYRVGNVDLTLCCEAPRLAPHRDAIRDTVAGLLQLPADAVNLKATTTEKLGFLGRAEGLAAFATVLIEQN